MEQHQQCKAIYHDFGRVLHEPNAGERIGDVVEILGLAVYTVAHDIAADDLVLAHLHYALRGRLGLSLEYAGHGGRDSGRAAFFHIQLFARGLAGQ